MQVGVGYSDNPDSTAAGRLAAEEAISNSGREDQCDLVLLFCTARHDARILRSAVAQVTGNDTRIYGGGAAGIITNDSFGYAGDQVGVACVWLEGAACEAVVDGGLLEGEADAGARLGGMLGDLGIEPETPTVLFYDAVDKTHGDVRLVMATWILEGLEKGLGFLPDLVGAGMQGDHNCSPVEQFIGEGMAEHCAMALTFPQGIGIDTAIMHGCRPASTYHTVTKADGPVILEIDGKPALTCMDELLGSSIAPEEYPFFLLFGLNHGDRWGEYDEDDYASRLCLGIDKERGGIVMFEPDMVEGTQFQLMFRSLGLEYMKPKIESLFEQLDGREPVFALYIDCAGRCAGYGGNDMEDAVVVQEIVGDRVPLLGLYTGVEIASIGGKPRGLDWTGVFCLFSKDDGRKRSKAGMQMWDSSAPNNASGSAADGITIEAVQKLAEQNAAKILELDTQSIAIRHELEQKRRGFGLLSELAVSLRQSSDYQGIFVPVAQRINAALNMQRTIVLFPDPAEEGLFYAGAMQGYTEEERAVLHGARIAVDPMLLDEDHPVVVTSADDEGFMEGFRKAIKLPYFISMPILVRSEVIALLVTGRLVEQVPFLSQLNMGDVENVQAIGALLSSVVVHQRLDAVSKQARTDPLTGLLNRGALEFEVDASLHGGRANDQSFAFLMIDFDHFKDVNDTYGHLQGDMALKALAAALRSSFRSSDIVARFGGDEFAVFCPTPDDESYIIKRVESLIESWRSTPMITEGGGEFYATLSIGIAFAPKNGMTYDELFGNADIALYRSKQNGRDRYTVFE